MAPAPLLADGLPKGHVLREAQWIWPGIGMYLLNSYAHFRHDFVLPDSHLNGWARGALDTHRFARRRKFNRRLGNQRMNLAELGVLALREEVASLIHRHQHAIKRGPSLADEHLLHSVAGAGLEWIDG